MKVKKNLFLYILSIALLMPCLGLAQEPEQEKNVSYLDEIVVTASRAEEKKKELTVNITVIDENEINLSTARDLGDLLAEKAGVYIRKYPGTLTSIGLRGFRTETHGNDLKGHVLILLNGRRAGTGNVAKIMTKNVERIEIIRGPAAVQYGSGAMGGLVNVITKKGTDKPSFFVEGLLGSFGYEEESAGFSGKVKDFDFSGSFTRSIMDDYDTGSGGDKFHNTGFDNKQNISLNIGYEFLPGNRIGFVYTCFDADRVGNPGYFSLNDLDDYKDTTNKSLDFIYEGSTADALFSWKARYFSGEDEDKWSDPVGSNPDFWDDGFPDKKDTDQEGAQAQFSLNLDMFTVTAGVDWVDYDIKNSWAPQKTEYENTAGFVLGKVRLLDERLILTGGLRYDEYDVEVTKPDGRDEDDDNLSPSVGAAYMINDFFKVRVNYAEAFVMPGADEMAADYVTWGTHYVGNPDLDPEESKTYEGGFDFSYQGFNASLTYFYTDFKDKIERVVLGNGDSSWDNLDDATISGFECEFSYDLALLQDLDFQLVPYVNFVYLDKFEDDKTHKDIQYTSDITASFGIGLNRPDDLSASLSVSYTGEQDITDYEYGTYQRKEKGGFTTADFIIVKQLYKSSEYGGISLRGEITNIFDKDYEYVQGSSMPGRSFFIGLRYEY